MSYYDKPWELFNLDADRSESNDLAAMHPEVIKRLDAAYTKWAERIGVIDWSVARTFSVYSQMKKK